MSGYDLSVRKHAARNDNRRVRAYKPKLETGCQISP